MKKVCIIGHYGFGKTLSNGQTIKTKIVTEEIGRVLGKDKLVLLDLAGGVKKIPYLLLLLPWILIECDNIIIMPVENGLSFLVPVLSLLNCVFKKKLHYVVIGGWLSNFLYKKKCLRNWLIKFNSIYVETDTMKNALERMGFNNIIVMPNCKNLMIIHPQELVYSYEKPLKLCTFSRVMEEKGIGTAIEVIKKVNEKLGYIAFSLDIYGPVWEDSQKWFYNIQQNLPEYVSYKGCIDADKSVEILKEYFALLFPTHFYTEGIPGTIIDAYAAGVPVISAKWESFADIVLDGKSGLGYEFNNSDALEMLMKSIADYPDLILNMKKNCVEIAFNYIPQNVIKIILNRILFD